jgi:hypothetical protein
LYSLETISRLVTMELLENEATVVAEGSAGPPRGLF